MFFCAGSFTKPVRLEIKDRAEGRSELSGENSRPLVCAHLDHKGARKGKRKKYNTPTNGLLVTDIEHLAHHLLFKNNTDLIGISTDENDLTLLALSRSIKEFDDTPTEDLQEKLVHALDTWSKFYNIDKPIEPL